MSIHSKKELTLDQKVALHKFLILKEFVETFQFHTIPNICTLGWIPEQDLNAHYINNKIFVNWGLLIVCPINELKAVMLHELYHYYQDVKLKIFTHPKLNTQEFRHYIELMADNFVAVNGFAKYFINQRFRYIEHYKDIDLHESCFTHPSEIVRLQAVSEYSNEDRSRILSLRDEGRKAL